MNPPKKKTILLIEERHTQEGDTRVKSSQCISTGSFLFLLPRKSRPDPITCTPNPVSKQGNYFPCRQLLSIRTACAAYSYDTYIPLKSHPLPRADFSCLSSPDLNVTK